MSITPTKKEIQVLTSLSKSNDGLVLKEYLQKIIHELSDVRNMSKEETQDSVVRAINLLEEHLINKLNILSKEVQENDPEQDFV